MRSTFKDDFRGDIEEPVDKVYFRRRDEESMYAEAYFKNKVPLLHVTQSVDHGRQKVMSSSYITTH